MFNLLYMCIRLAYEGKFGSSELPLCLTADHALTGLGRSTTPRGRASTERLTPVSGRPFDLRRR